jgi:phosphodiesterase/alkaline phosphatase D-like protein
MAMPVPMPRRWAGCRLPANECLKLADYRKRYAQYRSDPDSKSFHATMPVIAVWDDHEVANDTYKDGAENHTEGTEGTLCRPPRRRCAGLARMDARARA